MTTTLVSAEPYDFEFDPKTTALLMIDMQRDFVYPGGFGEALGNDDSLLLNAVAADARVLDGCARRRASSSSTPARATVPTWPTCPPSQEGARQASSAGIGDQGPMGRILVRGEYGHDIVDELKPMPASRSSTSPARARSTPPTWTRS